MKNPLTPAGIEPATFRFVAQHLNHCDTAVPWPNPVRRSKCAAIPTAECPTTTTNYHRQVKTKIRLTSRWCILVVLIAIWDMTQCRPVICSCRLCSGTCCLSQSFNWPSRSSPSLCECLWTFRTSRHITARRLLRGYGPFEVYCCAHLQSRSSYVIWCVVDRAS
jgi:hypothetical protein